jgi:hypothetical protein
MSNATFGLPFSVFNCFGELITIFGSLLAVTGFSLFASLSLLSDPTELITFLLEFESDTLVFSMFFSAPIFSSLLIFLFF